MFVGTAAVNTDLTFPGHHYGTVGKTGGKGCYGRFKNFTVESRCTHNKLQFQFVLRNIYHNYKKTRHFSEFTSKKCLGNSNKQSVAPNVAFTPEVVSLVVRNIQIAFLVAVGLSGKSLRYRLSVTVEENGIGFCGTFAV